MALPSWVSPDESKPAPQPLLLVQSFVNTWDAEHGTDTLARPETAAPWLRATGLIAPGPDPSDAELRQAREVRESLRVLLARNGSAAGPLTAGPLTAGPLTAGPLTAGPPDAESSAVEPPVAELSSGEPPDAELGPLNALADAGSLKLRIDPAGQILLAPGSPQTLAAGLTGLLLVVRDAQQQGTWQRLKICGNPDCRWAFYDRSHTRRGAWCDMATCGNMIKNRNFRARQKR